MARAPLRTRFAIWMAVAIIASIAVYGAFVFIFMDREKAEIERGEQSIEQSSADEVLEALLLAAPIAIGGSVIAALVFSRRALAPIDDVVREANAITAKELHRRMPVPAREDELRELVVSLNGLLARVEEGFGAVARESAEASHELRTPLAVIATELEIALRRPRTVEEWQATGARTLDEIRRLSTLVEALLELSRADAPAAGGAAVDVAVVAEQVCGALAGAAESRGVALELDHHDGARVRGHAGALEGALRNLVGNALRFTPPGGKIAVSIEDRDRAVEIHVDDTGPGVAPDRREQVFEPFQRDPDSSGFGLGLAIVKKVVTAHGGAVAASASPLGGARFTITLPSAAT
ncbi:MAG TPA: ATP-binding protein [Kofleriaceae bacterium]|nr:ATP-binding protein [Kofleriaceae bacterium]